MNEQTRSRLLFWGALTVFASFLPWVSVAMRFGDGLLSLPAGEETLNGWHGTLTLLHVTVPNWFPVIAALCAVGYAFTAGARAAVALTVASGYALIHLAVVLVVGLNNNGTFGIGLILGGVGYCALLFTGMRLTGGAPKAK